MALRRQWPHRLEITVDEHEPLARWNDGALVSTRGEVFTAESRTDLPQFEGPEGHASEITERYRTWSDVLRPLSLAVTQVRLSPPRGMATGGDGTRRSAGDRAWAAMTRMRASRASLSRMAGRWAHWPAPARASTLSTCAIAAGLRRAFPAFAKRAGSRGENDMSQRRTCAW